MKNLKFEKSSKEDLICIIEMLTEMHKEERNKADKLKSKIEMLKLKLITEKRY